MHKRLDSSATDSNRKSVKSFRKSFRASRQFRRKGGSFIFLFLNAGAARLQEWGGRTLAGFAPSLDRHKRELRWESQRNDKKGRVIQQICNHVREGVEVIVAVRSSPGQAFDILGRTKDFSLDSAARFLLEEGNDVICERGSFRVHRVITPHCLDAALRTGIGLLARQYPLPAKSGAVFCSGCCWKPAIALLRFEQLGEEAADILDSGKRSPAQICFPDKHAAGAKDIPRDTQAQDENLPQIMLPTKEWPALISTSLKASETINTASVPSGQYRVRRVWRAGILEEAHSQFWVSGQVPLEQKDDTCQARVASRIPSVHISRAMKTDILDAPRIFKPARRCVAIEGSKVIVLSEEE
jgi:hypothetical protein